MSNNWKLIIDDNIDYKKENDKRIELEIEEIRKKEKKVKNKDFLFLIIKIFYFIVYSLLFLYFIHLVNLYSNNNTYEDNEVIIKEMPLWYNVFNKKGELKEVNFFNWKIQNNKKLVSYINEQLLFSNNKIKDKNWDIIILKDPTNLVSKTKENVIDNIIIKKIIKISQKDYIVFYLKNINKEYKYCFKRNNLNFSKIKNDICILTTKNKYNIQFKEYNNYYIIWINNKIYVYNINSKDVSLEINVGNTIISLLQNKKWDLQVITKDEKYNISHIYIDYYLIKRIKLNKLKLILDIKKFL